jgi:serine/threonine protein kinase
MGVATHECDFLDCFDCFCTNSEYRLIAKKGEGTFSEVLKAQCVKNGKMTAIKCMKSTFESEEQVNNLREIQALRRLSPHPGIIKLIEVLYEQVIFYPLCCAKRGN